MVDENLLLVKSTGAGRVGGNHYSSEKGRASQASLQLSLSVTPQILPVKYNFLPLMI